MLTVHTVFRVTVRVFFFKQKTAYEMRISDWSSDVCSSDLTEYRGAPQPRATRAGPAPHSPGCAEFPCFPAPGASYCLTELETSAYLALAAPAEIGRASCRERVCQYV